MPRIEPVDRTSLKDLQPPVRFDDRLLTVLSQPAADRLDIAVRWRQLVDLMARAGANASSENFVHALDTIRLDARNVDQALRASAARAIAPFPLPIGLLQYFASDDLDVSAPVLAAATLETDQWREVLSEASEETRRFVATLHPELLPEPNALAGGPTRLLAKPTELTEELIQSPEEMPARADELTDEQVEHRIGLIAQMVEASPDVPPHVPAAPSLQEVVERIERRRRSRSVIRTATPATPAPSSLFRWECGPGGEISWVDGAPRGALIGRSIARARNGEGDRIDREVVRAFIVRAPFRDGTLTVTGEGSVAGEWKISGVPAFDPADGRFRGYRGIAIREQAEIRAEDEDIEALADPDSLRELVHEIKTPLNAIIGFAEIIEGQYLGPAEPPYRDRAQEIVKQARLLLLAIDDLDLAAKMHSSTEEEDGGAQVDELIERMTPALRDLASARKAEVEFPKPLRGVTVDAEAELVDRLIFRMCVALIEQSAPGERLRLSVESAGARWRVSMTRPASLESLTEDQLVGTGSNLEQTFSLRLLRGLARIAGAQVAAPDGKISLLFPRSRLGSTGGGVYPGLAGEGL